MRPTVITLKPMGTACTTNLTWRHSEFRRLSAELAPEFQVLSASPDAGELEVEHEVAVFFSLLPMQEQAVAHAKRHTTTLVYLLTGAHQLKPELLAGGSPPTNFTLWRIPDGISPYHEDRLRKRLSELITEVKQRLADPVSR